MHDFVTLKIAEVRRETPDAVSVTFEIPDALRQAFIFKPGQHINVRAHLDGEELRRSYSICSGPGEPIRIAIKRLAGGAFSTFANTALNAGDTLEVMPPQGRFVLAPPDGTPRHVLALAAGAGITPVIAMAAHALASEPATRFTLVYGNRTVHDIIFREALEDLKDRFIDRFTIVHVLSRGDSEDGATLEGRITPDRLDRILPHIAPITALCGVYLCGPGTMIKDLRETFLRLGMARERIHFELFAAGGGAHRRTAESTPVPEPELPSARAGVHEIEAVLDGKRHRFQAMPGERLLDAALRAGIRAPYSCKGGMCSTCRGKIVSGSATMRVNYSLEPWETARGFVLTCQAVPTSESIVVDYDQM